MLSSLKYKQKGHLQQINDNQTQNIFSNHLSSSISLLNSRMRVKQRQLNKHPNEYDKYSDSLQQSSNKFNHNHNRMNKSVLNVEDEQYQKQHQQAVEQFKRQIQQRYKLSIANKLYTFPKLLIKDVFDIISSDEDDSQEDEGHYNQKIRHNQQQHQHQYQQENQDRHIDNHKMSSKFIEISNQVESNQSQKLQKYQEYNPFVQKNYQNISKKLKKPLKSQKIQIKQNKSKDKQKDKDKDKDKDKYDFKKKKQPNLSSSNTKKTKGLKQYNIIGNNNNNNHKKTASTFVKIQKQKQIYNNIQKIKQKKLQNKNIPLNNNVRNQRLKTQISRHLQKQGSSQNYSYLVGCSNGSKSTFNNINKQFKLESKKQGNFQIIQDQNQQNIIKNDKNDRNNNNKFHKKQQRLKTQVIQLSEKRYQDSQGNSYDFKMNIQEKWKNIVK